MSTPTIVWFRQDLRLADNQALSAAVQRGGPVIPIYIYAPEEESPWEPGSASRWWLHQSLAELSLRLKRHGSRLVLLQGPSLQILRRIVRETGAQAVYWNRRYEPQVLARDIKVKSHLQEIGVQVNTYEGGLLHEPWTIRNKAGHPFQVFSAFWRHCLTLPERPEPLPIPKTFRAPKGWPASTPLQSLELEPKLSWADGFKAAWQPGEEGAQNRVREFLRESFGDYSALRNRPDLGGTSRLSPHLHFGEITPRQIGAAATVAGVPLARWRHSQFFAEMGWREFAHHLLFHYPRTPDEPLRAEFSRFPWRERPELLAAWQKGRTGYPIVDAGMRELWSTGWMHNRVRMIVASFLVKDLLIRWNEGARWFWDTLVDADLAQNTLGWQWTAGCGADAAPFFRIFNPVLQGRKFDPNGDYVRRWCPELSALPIRWLHQPSAAPAHVLADAGVTLGATYPEPIVRHDIARDAALNAFQRIKRDSAVGPKAT